MAESKGFAAASVQFAPGVWRREFDLGRASGAEHRGQSRGASSLALTLTPPLTPDHAFSISSSVLMLPVPIHSSASARFREKKKKKRRRKTSLLQKEKSVLLLFIMKKHIFSSSYALRQCARSPSTISGRMTSGEKHVSGANFTGFPGFSV
eukprot:162529-Rhodomonas_salina.2